MAMMYVFGGSCLVAALATLPDWPFYNRHPTQWLPPKEGAAASGGGAKRSSPRGGGSASASGGSKKKKAGGWTTFWGMLPGVAAL